MAAFWRKTGADVQESSARAARIRMLFFYSLINVQTSAFHLAYINIARRKDGGEKYGLLGLRIRRIRRLWRWLWLRIRQQLCADCCAVYSVDYCRCRLPVLRTGARPYWARARLLFSKRLQENHSYGFYIPLPAHCSTGLPQLHAFSSNQTFPT